MERSPVEPVVAAPPRTSAPSADDPGKRRASGVYYTPDAVAQLLADWCIDARSARILDPSFGEGALLLAAAARLRALSVPRPAARLFGVDLNWSGSPAVRRHGLEVPSGQLLSADFFSIELDDLGGEPFDVIIGNPPYVRHHLLDASVRARAQRCADRAGVSLNERADAWAYFCVHATRFLAPEGRLALLLPASVLHAEYALPLLHALGKGRGHTTLVGVRERLFREVSERSVFLLIDRTVTGAGEVEYRQVDDMQELSAALQRRRRRVRPNDVGASERGLGLESRLKTRLRWHLESNEAGVWKELVERPEVTTLGALARLRIGVVTGANEWFIRTVDDTARLGRGVRTHPIVPRAVWLRAPWWGADELAGVHGRRSQLLMIDPRTEPSGRLQLEIERGVAQKLHERSHCARRNPWWSLDDCRSPELFLPYMGSTAPRLVLNTTRSTCTNAIHRVDLLGGAPPAAAMAAASWTSLARLSAELVGRSYGGGVLKLELGEAAQLCLPVIDGAQECLGEIGNALRYGGRDQARVCADKVLLEEGIGVPRRDLARLRAAADRLEHRRGR